MDDETSEPNLAKGRQSVVLRILRVAIVLPAYVSRT